MIKSTYFKIADHILLVTCPTDFELKRFLPNFRDFVVSKENVVANGQLVEVSVSREKAPNYSGNLKIHVNKSETWGEGFSFGENESYYVTSMRGAEIESTATMWSTKDFQQSTIYLGDSDAAQYSLISWFIMIAFGQAILPFKTVMIHASTVEKGEKEAYAFLGKSGTGKSTHSQLWLKYIEGFTLLNDDNPAVRVFDNNEVFIYGTPWSGKTNCYRNLRVPLSGFVRLSQAKSSSFQLTKNMEALIILLPSCTGIRWNKNLFNNMVDTIESIISLVPVGKMDCQISEEAAIISYNGIKFKNSDHEQ